MNVFFRGISFLWALAALVVFAAFFGLRAYMAYRRLKTDAATDWDYMVANNMQDLRLTKDAYIRTYCRVNAPRAAAYLAGGAALIVILIPVILSIINVSLWALWELNGQSRVFEPGYLVWEFSIFFLLIAICAGVGTLVARRYHAHEPGLMRDELMKDRMDFEPTDPLVVGANPVHIQAFAKGEGVSRQLYKNVFMDALGLSHTQDRNWNETGHVCDTYTDGSGMNICVHSAGKGGAGKGGTGKKGKISKTTHPFFFVKKHAREDSTDVLYSIIMKMKSAHSAFEKIEALGLPMDKATGHKHSNLRSFRHESVTFYLYEDR